MGPLASNLSSILSNGRLPGGGIPEGAIRIGLEVRPMSLRSVALLLCLALPLTLGAPLGSARGEQDKKPPARKSAGPTDIETDHWLVSASIPALPTKDFDQML